jgi:hypothetical protein
LLRRTLRKAITIHVEQMRRSLRNPRDVDMLRDGVSLNSLFALCRRGAPRQLHLASSNPGRKCPRFYVPELTLFLHNRLLAGKEIVYLGGYFNIMCRPEGSEVMTVRLS